MDNKDTAVLRAWDDFDRAAAAIQTAQPYQMTEAAERLEHTRIDMRETILAWIASGK